MTGKRNRQRNRHKRQIGLWKKVRVLGQGGNGQVWEVSRGGFENHAAKLLTGSDDVMYQRFKAETHILSTHSIDGMIPLVESYLPENLKNDRPWYVMPKATIFEEYAKDKKPLELAKDFVLLSQTLEKLHEKGISHRDIKPANILYHNNRLCFADFGLVKYPGKPEITPKKRDVGAKFTMAPEMRREASDANGLPADVYSLAKTLWIALTKQTKGFDGQYNPFSILSIQSYCDELYTTALDNLLVESTDNNAVNRPTAHSFTKRLSEWIALNENFHERNMLEWLEVQQVIFPTGKPSHATWTDVDSICAVLNEIARRDRLNHMFYPTGGGMDLISVSKAVEENMIALNVSERSAEIVKPKKLTFESVGYHPQWNYFRLELEEVESTGLNGVSGAVDYEDLLELEPGVYVPYIHWDEGEYNGESLPPMARPVTRFTKGSFVLFSKRSIYNRTSETYDGRHNKMTEAEFREEIESSARTCFEHDVE